MFFLNFLSILHFVLREVFKVVFDFFSHWYVVCIQFVYCFSGLFNLNKSRVSIFVYRYGILCNLFLLADESVSYSLFLIFRDVYFFIYICSYNLFFTYLLYCLYFFLIVFMIFLKFLVFEGFSCVFFFSIFFVLFFLCDFIIIIIFFFVLNLVFFFLEKVFRQRLASLFLFSRDFVCLEDEDTWISSNILYFDDKLVGSENIYVRLKTYEIDVFYTLMTLFFDVQKTNVLYSNYSTDFALLEMHKNERKKYFSKTYSSFTNQIADLRLKQNLVTLVDIDKTRSEFRFFNFYRLFHKLNFLYVESKHLRKKKLLLRNKQIKNRKLRFLRWRSQAKFTTLNVLDILSGFSQKQNLSSESVRLKSFLRFYSFPKQNESLFFVPSNKNFRYNSRFLKFFWFSFPVYLFRFNYAISRIVLLFSRRFFSVLIGKCLEKFYLFIYSWADPLLEPGNYVRQTFFRFRDFSLYWKKSSSFFVDFDQFLSFVSFAIENEISDSNKDVPVSEPEDVNSLDFKEKEQKENILLSQKYGSEQRSKRTPKFQFSKAAKIRKSRRKYKLTRRKPFTSRYVWINTRRKYLFLNQYSLDLYKKYPNLKFIDLYKLLEYFYFVLVNDSDFYQNVDFAAKVALLKDKYGSAIVNDLLSKDDHRQARSVSMQMHVSEITESNGLRSGNENEIFSEISGFPSSESSARVGFSEGDISDVKSKLKLGPYAITPNISLFAKSLIRLYRSRLRG